MYVTNDAFDRLVLIRKIEDDGKKESLDLLIVIN